jgi:dUTP pyrophosphatase
VWGVIDPDYRGEIMVWLMNTSAETRTVRPGQRIAQLLFLPVFRRHPDPGRDPVGNGPGRGRFGHTGE